MIFITLVITLSQMEPRKMEFGSRRKKKKGGGACKKKKREKGGERGLAFETGMRLLIIWVFYLVALVLSAQQDSAKLCCLWQKYRREHTRARTHLPFDRIQIIKVESQIHKIEQDLSSGAQQTLAELKCTKTLTQTHTENNTQSFNTWIRIHEQKPASKTITVMAWRNQFSSSWEQPSDDISLDK